METLERQRMQMVETERDICWDRLNIISIFTFFFLTDSQLQKQATSLVFIFLKSCKYSALNHANITTNNNDTG